MTDLSASTDQLSDALRDVEDAILGLRLGVAATVPFGAHRLAWEKYNGEWALAVISGETRTPILKASRLLRVLAVDALPALHAALLDEYARQDGEVSRATHRARAFSEMLRRTAERAVP